MKERPILFSGPMVKAILEGRKTQTRRPIKPHPPTKAAVKALAGIDYGLVTDLASDGYDNPDQSWWRVAGPVWAVRAVMGIDESPGWKCPYGHAGDRLWVRESWQAIHVWIDPETGHGDDFDYAKRIPKAPTPHPISASLLDGDKPYWQAVYKATDPQADYHREDRGFPWRPGIHMPKWASRITLEVDRIVAQPLQEMTEDDAKAEGVESLAAFKALWASIHGPGFWGGGPWVWVVHFHAIDNPK